MPTFKNLDDVEVSGKRVLVRVDLNVPMSDGKVSDATRILRILPTIGEISEKGGKVILLAHFGRPKGERNEDMSLAPVVVAANCITISTSLSAHLISSIFLRSQYIHSTLSYCLCGCLFL